MAMDARLIAVGVNDHEIDLFEGQYVVPEGMAYNSYVLMGERLPSWMAWMPLLPANGWATSKLC